MILGHKKTSKQGNHSLIANPPVSKCFIVFVLALSLFSGGCSSPSLKLAKQQQWAVKTVKANGFEIFSLDNKAEGDEIHIYLGGDGRPWIDGKLIAKDPTSRKPLAPQLMALDKQRSIYLGRPCYHLGGWKSLEAPCNPELWTFQRYSPLVLNTMKQALEQLLATTAERPVTLIGFSGGGVIATLLGEEFKQVKRVITVAANLDIDLWTQSKGYLPLEGSINPSKKPRLRKDLERLHLIGGKDKSVPPKVTRAFIERHGGEERFYENFDHRCCWLDIWQEFIN